MSNQRKEEKEKDPAHVAAGLKAAIANPHVSPEAKSSAAERLESLAPSSGSQNYAPSAPSASAHDTRQHTREAIEAVEAVEEDEHMTRVRAGYKAALHNPRVSKEAKEKAQAYLEEDRLPE